MSIPLDRLYNFLQDVVNPDIIIYRWTPHGSKKLEDLKQLRNYSSEEETNLPILIAHDQEPLSNDPYNDQELQSLKQHFERFSKDVKNIDFATFKEHFEQHHWRSSTCNNIHQRTLLTHSELHSDQLKLFRQKGYVPIYFWSHALLARDWYRYAQHDPALKKHKPKQLFLIHNRAWSGTREYRLKFANMLAKSGLSEQCRMGFNPIDSNENYRVHEFKNPAFQIDNTDLEQYFFENTIGADASADYCVQDYQETQVEVVLETLFDDLRWHLTEKTLRPIACGHPFILAATPGSLQYLRNYGFETFAGLIDETYDTIEDPVQRLKAIMSAMNRLLTADQTVWNQLRAIAARNQQRFFSAEFQQKIIDEFKTNFDQAILTITPSQPSAGG